MSDRAFDGILVHAGGFRPGGKGVARAVGMQMATVLGDARPLESPGLVSMIEV